MLRLINANCIKKILSAGILTSLWLIPISVSATSSDWRDITYDFDTIQKIYVDTAIKYSDNAAVSELDHLKNLKAMEEYSAQLKKYTLVDYPDQADAIVTLNVKEWGEKSIWQEERYYTETVQIEHIDEINDTKTTEDTTVEMYKEGYYYPVEYFDSEFIVTDKQGKIIYTKTDSREDSKNAFAMFGRAIKDFYKTFNETKP